MNMCHTLQFKYSLLQSSTENVKFSILQSRGFYFQLSISLRFLDWCLLSLILIQDMPSIPRLMPRYAQRVCVAEVGSATARMVRSSVSNGTSIYIRRGLQSTIVVPQNTILRVSLMVVLGHRHFG